MLKGLGLWGILVLFTLIAGCGLSLTGGDDPADSADGTAKAGDPQVEITAPSNGAEVSGTVVIEGTASDDTALSSVEVQIDSDSFKDVEGASLSNWSYNWNTTQFKDGEHTITVRATDDEDNKVTDSIKVTVSNTSGVVSDDTPAGSATIQNPTIQALIYILVTLVEGFKPLVVAAEHDPGGSTQAILSDMSAKIPTPAQPLGKFQSQIMGQTGTTFYEGPGAGPDGEGEGWYTSVEIDEDGDKIETFIKFEPTSDPNQGDPDNATDVWFVIVATQSDGSSGRQGIHLWGEDDTHLSGETSFTVLNADSVLLSLFETEITKCGENDCTLETQVTLNLDASGGASSTVSFMGSKLVINGNSGFGYGYFGPKLVLETKPSPGDGVWAQDPSQGDLGLIYWDDIVEGVITRTYWDGESEVVEDFSLSPGGPSSANVTSVTVSSTLDVISVGGTTTVSATVEYDDGNTDSDVSWTSSDPSIATVSTGSGSTPDDGDSVASQTLLATVSNDEDTVATQSSSGVVVKGIAPGSVTITATSNEDPFESASTQILVTSGATILLVDDDAGSNNGGFSTDVESYYKTALDALGLSYDEFTVPSSADGPSSTQLSAYDIVIWFNGGDFSSTSIITDNDEVNMKAFLDGGGNLFLSSHDYYSARGSTVTDFMKDYLRVTSVNESNFFTLTGQIETIGQGMSFSDSFEIFESSDELTLNSGAIAAFANEASSPAKTMGLQYDSGTFKVVYFAFPFANLKDSTSPSTKKDLMDNVIKFLSGTWTPPPLPDLAVTSVSGPSTASPGDTISVSVSVKNQGGASAGTSSYKLYLSDDSTITASDTVLIDTQFNSTFDITSLAAGATDTATKSVTIPSTVSSETQFIGVIADSGLEVTESDELNNTGTYSITVLLPDLIVTNVSGPATASPTDNINISVSIKNQGGSSAGSSSYKIVLSDDNTIEASDIQLHIFLFTTPSLAAGMTDTATEQVTIPSSASVGAKHIGVIADTNGSVTESDESNNIGSSSITIQ